MFYQLSIAILIPGLSFDGDVLENKSLGGSETAGVCMARELARVGNRVTVFCNCERQGLFDGVTYLNQASWLSYLMTTPCDVFIAQRTPEPFQNKLVSKLNYMWCHDMAMGRMSNQFRGAMWNIDGVFVLSQFHKDQYAKTYGIDPSMLIQTRNGIDVFRFPSLVPPWERNVKRLVYSARPERGMDNMLTIFEMILQKDPEFTLDIYGYDNTVPHLQDLYNNLQVHISKFQGKARFAGNLKKDDLYRQYAISGIYAYPTPSILTKTFREISCISAMEAMASGMPIVTSKNGALPETVHPEAGALIDGDPWSSEYREAFVQQVLEIGNNMDRYGAMSAAGSVHARMNLSWNTVAEEWTKFFHEEFSRKNNNRTRLAYYFYKRSDIFAARAALEHSEKTDPAAKRLSEKIEKEYGFTNSRKEFAEHYRRHGKETLRNLQAAGDAVAFNFTDSQEKRFHTLRDVLARHPECQSILEYGCGHGWSTIYLSNQVGRRWHSVDVDPGAIEMARSYAQKYAKNAGALTFAVGDYQTEGVLNDPVTGELYDCALLSEVLEHCVDPYAVIEAVERMVKPGGLIIITTPYGYTEFGTPNWEWFRNHLWEFEIHDLTDMFGQKRNLIINGQTDHMNERVWEPVGFFMLEYTADHAPIGRINMERKLFLQNPRQTIAASIIAGESGEDTMRWCLRSVAEIADDIVVIDTGMTEYGRNTCYEFGARVFKGSDPKAHGFETPRNEGLDKCDLDWVLWIDTDERLLNQAFLLKYLRSNFWHGYSLKQHHFACDTTFNPDMPVRVFRREPRDGKTMRFFGMCHEHPELSLNEGPGPVLILPDVMIAHVGYLTEGIRRQRFVRNNPLLMRDKEKYPDRVLQKYLIMRDLCLMNMYDLQNNGQKITAEIRARAMEACELYRKYFLGKPGYVNIDALPYYSEALRILGEGVDVAFSVAANRDGHGDALNGNAVRFASVDEAVAELNLRLKQKLEPLLMEDF